MKDQSSYVPSCNSTFIYAIAVILCAFLLLLDVVVFFLSFSLYYSTRMVNVLKECDYHQSDERKGKKKQAVQMTICVRLQCNIRIVHTAHLCTGGGDTYFLCAVYTECTVHTTI